MFRFRSALWPWCRGEQCQPCEGDGLSPSVSDDPITGEVFGHRSTLAALDAARPTIRASRTPYVPQIAVCSPESRTASSVC